MGLANWELLALSSALLLSYSGYQYHYGGVQFYPLCRQLHQSRLWSAFVIGNLFLAAVVFCEQTIHFLFGKLHPSEEEHLNESRVMIFLEIASTFVMFQSRFSWSSYAEFVFLLYFTLAHRVLEKRIEQANIGQVLSEESTGMTIPTPSHTANVPDPRAPVLSSQQRHQRRIVALLLLLSALNLYQLCKFISRWRPTAHSRISLLSTVFIHRYVVTTCLLSKCASSFLLNWIEDQMGHNADDSEDSGWDAKMIYSTLVELLTSALVTLSNLLTVICLVAHHHRPINLIRFLFRNTFRLSRSVENCIGAYRTFRRMQYFRVPSDDELALIDVCAICLDQMSRPMDARKVPNCRHIFHYRCLKRWALNRQICPTCRTDL